MKIHEKGFKEQTVPPFQLEIDRTAKIDVKLAPGGATSTVDVNTLAPILDMTNSSLGISLSTSEIADLSLNGWNFSSMPLFQPGAVNTDPQGLAGGNH